MAVSTLICSLSLHLTSLGRKRAYAEEATVLMASESIFDGSCVERARTWQCDRDEEVER